VLILVIIPMTINLGACTYPRATMIFVDPQLSEVEVLETFQINISVSEVTDLAGWDFKLYYQNSILNATNVTEGLFLQTAGDTFFFVKELTDKYNETTGRIWVACVLTGQGSGATGNGTLATITFKAKLSGNATLHLAETELIDSQMPPQNIEHLTLDGTVEVSLHRDLAVTNVVVAQTIVGQNSCNCTGINVTVTNQGDLTEVVNVTLEVSRHFGVTDVNLWGSAIEGWGVTEDNMTSPGPTITVNQGDIVSLTLTSHDGLMHNFFVDYDGDMSPSLGEPKSLDFTTTIDFVFMPSTLGGFTYYCQYHKITMYGTFMVNTPTITPVEVGKEEITLANGSSKTLTFCWNTIGFTKGNYTISAVVDIVPGETDTADNTLVDGWVFVTIPGDVDGDMDIDIFDIVAIAGAYGSKEGDPKYVSTYDLDCDGDIDIFDIVAAAGNDGKSW